MKSIFQSPLLKKHLSHDRLGPWIIAKYFFSELNGEQEQEFDGLLHSLLWQILSQRWDLLPFVVSVYNTLTSNDLGSRV
jgi:hypothetical protein